MKHSSIVANRKRCCNLLDDSRWKQIISWVTSVWFTKWKAFCDSLFISTFQKNYFTINNKNGNIFQEIYFDTTCLYNDKYDISWFTCYMLVWCWGTILTRVSKVLFYAGSCQRNQRFLLCNLISVWPRSDVGRGWE